MRIRRDRKDPSLHRAPRTIDEAVDIIIRALSADDCKIIRETPDDDLYIFHHGWGTGIRNAFGLWQGNGALNSSCFLLRYGCKGQMHSDDASMVIIRAVWNELNGRPRVFRQRRPMNVFSCVVCKSLQHTEVVLDMPDDPLTPAQKALLSKDRCDECKGLPIPPPQDPGVKPKKWRVGFERARKLGLSFGSEFKRRAGNNPLHSASHDDRLLQLAGELYQSEPEFRALWDLVREVPPGKKDCVWLNLWVRP